jgi:L-threonylcarbamoyladenylate synthase
MGYLGWGQKEEAAYSGVREVRWLSERDGDWLTAAQNLFRQMRELDEAGLEVIYARRVPEEGLGRAIMDRLRRASAKRPD